LAAVIANTIMNKSRANLNSPEGSGLQQPSPRFFQKHFVWMGGVFFLIVSAAISGGLIGSAWLDDRFGWLGICGIGLFLLTQWQYQRFLPVALHGLLTGYLAFLIASPWTHDTVYGLLGGSEYAIIGVVQGVHLFHGGLWFLFAIFWWAARRFLRGGWMLAPAIWVLLEAVYPGMYPLRQGCLLSEWKPLIQIASIFGIAGVTLQAILLASLIPLSFFALKKKVLGDSTASRTFDRLTPQAARCSILVVLALTTLNAGWGALRMGIIEQADADFKGERLDVLLVQGETELAQSHADMAERSRALAGQCELVVWPECAFGRYNQELTDFSDDYQVSSNSIGINYSFRPMKDPGCYVMGGGYSWTSVPNQPVKRKVESKFVSAFLLDPSEKLVGRHDKIELMAGGEYLPGRPWLPAVIGWFVPWQEPLDYDPHDYEFVKLSQGVDPAPVGDVVVRNEPGKKVTLAAMLCCEDMYPWLAREMVNEGADVLVCMANGMCFDSELPLQQHFQLARFRAIENNRYFVRAGSYGVSGLISPTGRLSQTGPCFEEIDLVVSVPTDDRPLTLYTRFGDTLNWLCLFWVAMVSLYSLSSKRRSPVNQNSELSK